MQTVVKKGSLITDAANPQSPAGAVDLVSAVEYDALGREQFRYLPFAANTAGNTSVSDGFFKLNPFQQQASFYGGTTETNPIKGQGESFFYGRTVFEASPLSRPVESYAPGNSWMGSDGTQVPKSVKQKYWINTIDDQVRIWNVSNSINVGDFATYTTLSGLEGIYPAGQLYKNVTEDERGKQVIEFKDKEGKVILKKVQLQDNAYDDGTTGKNHAGWLCTYYLYDDLGQLRCVVQPKAVGEALIRMDIILKQNKLSNADVRLTNNNVSPATKALIFTQPKLRDADTRDPYILGTISLKSSVIKTANDATASDADIQAIKSLSDNDVSHPTVAKDKEGSAMARNNPLTKIVDQSSGTSKGDLILAMISLTTDYILNNADGRVKDDITIAQNQASTFALSVFGDINTGMLTGIIPSSYNSTDLTQLANYLLFGEQPSNQGEVDQTKLSNFKRMQSQISNVKSNPYQCIPCRQ